MRHSLSVFNSYDIRLGSLTLSSVLAAENGRRARATRIALIHPLAVQEAKSRSTRPYQEESPLRED